MVPARESRDERLSDLLAEYATWLRVERGLAPNSLAAYRRDLKRYEAYLRRIGELDPTTVTEATVAAYVDELRNARDEDGRPRFAPASIARAVAAVRSFHRFCVEEGLLLSDPSEDIGGPRVPQGIPKALTEVDVSALLDAVAGEEPRALRDRAMLETLYGAGLRISELVGLDIGDLDLHDGLVRVLGKGSKERVTPVGRTARAALGDYLTRGRPELTRPRARAESAVFLNARGGRLTRQGAWLVVRHAGDRAGLSDRLFPHVLRHSCATHMLDHGADIRVVQELLGHASLSTTQVYTKVSPERLRAVYDAAHPRAHHDRSR
ncbi:MAG: site-specific tyrosine recombinase XerD [Acidimicrobiia bacterium]